jgi:hypothetical protein
MKRTFFSLLTLSLLIIALPVNAENLTPAQQRGRALAAEFRNQKPVENFSATGLFVKRDDAGRRQRIPFKFNITVGISTWQNIYEALSAEEKVTERLTIVHTDGQPNQYLLARASASGSLTELVLLTGEQATIPFATTDFWLADLGLEFLHWPEQRVLRNEMRHSMPCKVLESINPSPRPGQYSRVLSWVALVDGQPTGLLKAQAYDQQQKLLKEFNFREVQKINGRYQLKELEILNQQTDTRTRLEFDLEVQVIPLSK